MSYVPASASATASPPHERSLRYPTSNPGSTSDLCRHALATCTAAAGTLHARTVSDGILNEKDWRWNYHRHAVEHVRVCADASPERCVRMAQAGLDALYGSFLYGDGEGTLRDVLEERRRRRGRQENNDKRRGYDEGGGFVTGRMVGTGTKRKEEDGVQLSLPVGTRTLLGPEVYDQMDAWSQSGVIEPDTAAAVRNLRPQDLDLAADPKSSCPWAFVVMGAGAAMGPLETLLSLGATVVALDLPVPAVWEHLARVARDSPGTLLFPIRRDKHEDSGGSGRGGNNGGECPTATAGSTGDADCHAHDFIIDIDPRSSESITYMSSRAGCDLLRQIPELIDWLVDRACPDRRLVLGSYAYLDSAAFVRVSLAMDAIASETLRERPDSALAYLCSPTDVFAVPPGARDAAAAARSRGRAEDGGGGRKTAFQGLVSSLAPRGRVLDPNIVASTRNSAMPLVDALVLQQGPNYFLAKRLQHWRAIVAGSGDLLGSGGAAARHVVSSNVAPASNTRSVLKNRLLAAAYAGAHHFSPIEIFDPETSNVLMTYLLLHDLRCGTEREEGERRGEGEGEGLRREAARGPFLTTYRRTDLVDHPLNLFATTPVHNGIWRCGYQIRSLLELVVMYYFVDRCKKPVVAAATAAGIGAVVLRSKM